jgi:hypothetical protein
MDPFAGVVLQSNGSYLKATIGQNNQFNDAVKEILASVNLNQYQNVLIDTRTQPRSTPKAGMFIEGEILGRLWPQDVRLALLVPPETKEDEHLLRIAAASHGLKFATFTEEAEAVNWLTEAS